MRLIRIIFILSIICGVKDSFSQTNKSYHSKVRKVILGSEIGFARYVFTPISGDDYLATRWRTVPTLGYLFKSKIGVGIAGEFETFKDTNGRQPNRLGYGLFLRYYPIDVLKWNKISDYIRPYIGTSYHWTNYIRTRGANIIYSDEIENNQFKAIGGLQVALWRGLAIGIGFHYVWFFDSNRELTDSQFIQRIVVEYHF